MTVHFVGDRLRFAPAVGTKKIPELLATSTPTGSVLGAIVVGLGSVVAVTVVVGIKHHQDDHKTSPHHGST